MAALAAEPAVAGVDVGQLRAALMAGGFRGEVEDDRVLLAAAACDNSVYQIMPDVVVAPRDEADVVRLLEVLADPAFSHLAVTARGGGTGTNGQSLNHGVIVDFRRHMHRILKIDTEAGWAEVEPGVVLDALNAEAAKQGLQFGPETSTASRCTIGGMVATDASGKGSRIYGKTADNVLGLTLVQFGGPVLNSDDSAPLPTALAQLGDAVDAAKSALLTRLPDLPRRFSGYDAIRARAADGTLEWWRLVVGAEGTLGLVTRIRVKLVPREPHRQLIILAFSSFSQALRAGTAILSQAPLAIEVMDEGVQRLAREAGLLHGLPEAVRGTGDAAIAYSFVEFVGHDAEVLNQTIDAARAQYAKLQGLIGLHTAERPPEIARLWGIRSAAVGLLGKRLGARRPMAFVEDCVVPVPALVQFVEEFRALLDTHGLDYGIYGHVDAGCLHVRPALDIDRDADRALLGELSDAVYALTERHGGIFWGEHGKGVRGAYLEKFVGPDAYRAFLAIKAVFDPEGRFNPGKLVDPHGLKPLRTTPMRRMNGPADSRYGQAYRCNGNAHCLSVSAAVPICPSFKATGDLRLSPKGRADGFRALERVDLPKAEKLRLEDDLAQSLDLCLSCKACAGACPVMVDIPEMKSRFLEVRYQTHQRPIADHLAIALEGLAPFILHVSRLAAPVYNLLRKPIGRFAGLVDLPAMDVWPGIGKAITVEQAQRRDWAANTVFVVPDAFTSLFDGTAQAAVVAALTALGYAVQPVALSAGPKAAHVRGARKIFEKRAKRLHQQLARLAALGLPMVGFDPAFVLMARQELLSFGPVVPMKMVHEFLSDELAAGTAWPRAEGRPGITIALHCTEASADPAAGRTWQRVMEALGFDAQIAPTGCCGMAGLFGHETRHQEMSRILFDMSWKSASSTKNAAATGFSCRCQSARLGQQALPNPMALVAQALGSKAD